MARGTTQRRRPPGRQQVFALALAFALLGALLSCPRAYAYCREVTESPPDGFDPAVDGCFDGDPAAPDAGPVYPLFWRNACVGYSFLQEPSSTISLADATRVAQEAFGAWSNAACPTGTPSIHGVLLPPVDCDVVPSNEHNNVILFRENGWPHTDASNTIGYTTLTVHLGDGEILGADIEINATNYPIVADPPAPAGGYDLGSILTHEAGHFLGLAHSADSTAVMYAFYQPGSTTLMADDISGICSLYTPEGLHDSSYGPLMAPSCSPAPPLGFLTACGSLDSGLMVDTIGSGAGPAGIPGGDTSPCIAPSCNMGGAPGFAGAGLALFGLTALAGAIRRTRRTSARPGAVVLRCLLGGGLVAGATGAAREARASVAVQVLFEELVQESSAVAVVSPLEHQSVWEGGRIVTYTRVRIEQLLAGDTSGEVWVRTLGGSVGDIGQLVEGDASFTGVRPSLVFLRAHLDPLTGAPTGTFAVAERAQGQFPVVVSDGRERLTMASEMGVLVAPPAVQVTRASRRLPPGVAPRFARDVLRDRLLDDAAKDIALAWSRAH